LFLLPFLYRDFGWQQRYARFCGRVVVLSILALLLYPFLWSWTIIGTIWFRSAKSCVCFSFKFNLSSTFVNKFMVHNAYNHLQLPEEGQKWGFLIWLLFSYCGLLCIACMSVGKVSGGAVLTIRYFFELLPCHNLFSLQFPVLFLFWITYKHRISAKQYYSSSLFNI
jgi:hypothetical protein